MVARAPVTEQCIQGLAAIVVARCQQQTATKPPGRQQVKKGYWVIAWKSISDPAAVERYIAAGTEAILAHGGRILAGGVPARAYEEGVSSRLVLVEFDSLQSAVSAYESADYQASLVTLVGAAERDVRIIEGSG